MQRKQERRYLLDGIDVGSRSRCESEDAEVAGEGSELLDDNRVGEVALGLVRLVDDEEDDRAGIEGA